MARAEPDGASSVRDRDLSGRVTVMTGGASGIGRGIVRSLAEAGARTVVADVDHAAAEAGTDHGESVAATCDVRDRLAVEALPEMAWGHFGHVDMAFDNAGVLGPSADCIAVDEASARDLLDVNLIGAWHGCSVFGRRFIDQGTPANTVNTASESGIAAPVSGRPSTRPPSTGKNCPTTSPSASCAQASLLRG